MDTGGVTSQHQLSRHQFPGSKVSSVSTFFYQTAGLLCSIMQLLHAAMGRTAALWLGYTGTIRPGPLGNPT